MTTGLDRPEAPLDAIISPALELAWLVAKASSEARPPTPFPSALRPLLNFTKLNTRARATLRRVLDEDDEFRAKVALAVTDEAGRAAALFLQRPEGWEGELANLEADRAGAAARGDEGRVEREAMRKLAGAEAARRRSDAALAEARASLERATAEVAVERQQRRQLEAQASRSDRRAESLAAERDRARQRADAVADEVADLRATVTRLQAELTERDAVPDAVRVGVKKLEGAIEAARDAVGEIARALDAGRSVPKPNAPPRRPTQKRVPLRLPLGLLDDSVEAAEYLVRTPGVKVFVDGYNATLSVWAGVALAEQRIRLLDAANELAARSGAGVLVVFDGDEQAGRVPPEGRRSVTWRFSPPGVEADDVILDLIDATPISIPVVVASSDRRVQDGARSRGANVMTTVQLFGVLRREAG